VNSEFPLRKWAEVLLFIERALQLSSKREKREKTTPSRLHHTASHLASI
jgi:hypothetical protein